MRPILLDIVTNVITHFALFNHFYLIPSDADSWGIESNLRGGESIPTHSGQFE